MSFVNTVAIGKHLFQSVIPCSSSGGLRFDCSLNQYRAHSNAEMKQQVYQLPCVEKMCVLIVTVVTSLTMPAPVVARTCISSESEDGD